MFSTNAVGNGGDNQPTETTNRKKDTIMKNAINQPTLKDLVAEFDKCFASAIEYIERSAKAYAMACRLYPEKAQAEFEKKRPQVSPCTWDKLRAIGNGDANPNIMFLSNQFAAKIVRMPKRKQDEVLNGDSFDVFNPTSRQVDRINYTGLKPRHETILFDDTATKIRTIPEQVAYTDLVAAEKKSKHRDWIVHDNYLEIKCACNIGKNELESIVEEMA